MGVRYVEDLEGLRDCYKAVKAGKRVAYDLETTGLEALDDSILLLQFCADGGDCFVIPANQHDAEHVYRILELLADGSRITLAHNAAFEYQYTLVHHGVKLGRVYDSMLAEGLLTAGTLLPTGLDETVQRRLGLTLDKTLQKSFIGADPQTFSPTPEQIAYAAADVALLHDLRAQQVAALQAEGLMPVAGLEFDACPVFAEMALNGMLLDVSQHSEILAKYKADAQHFGVVAAGVLDEFWQKVAQRQHDADKVEYDRLQAIIAGGLAATKLTALYNEIITLEDAGKQDTKKYAGVVERCAATQQQIADATAVLGREPAPLVPGSEAVAELRKQRDGCKPKPVEPINLNSGQQVLAALAESGISLPNLQGDTVEEYQDRSPVLAAYSKYVKAQKVVSTYGDSLAERVRKDTGRVHFSYRQIVRTGRTSSDGAQVMPKDIRACFKPAPGNVFVVADFANMELRIFAGLSQDPTLLLAFKEGVDLHCLTAAHAWPELYGGDWRKVPKDSDHRAKAKISNFAAIYGADAAALHYALGLPMADAKAIQSGIETAWSVGWGWIHEAGEQSVHTGYAVTALGRKRYFAKLAPCPRGWAEAKDWKKLRGKIVRAAMNHPVQGTGADIAKRSMVLIHRGGGRVVGMVHDEIIVECAEADADRISKLVADSMVAAGAELIKGVAIPADVHVVTAWVK